MPEAPYDPLIDDVLDPDAHRARVPPSDTSAATDEGSSDAVSTSLASTAMTFNPNPRRDEYRRVHLDPPLVADGAHLPQHPDNLRLRPTARQLENVAL